MTNETKSDLWVGVLIGLLIVFVLSIVFFSPVAHADISSNLQSKTCVQFLADSKEMGAANVANGRMVQSYLIPFGFGKTDQSQWHMSILVWCIMNKQGTFLDAVKVLVKELHDETLI